MRSFQTVIRVMEEICGSRWKTDPGEPGRARPSGKEMSQGVRGKAFRGRALKLRA